MKIKEIWFDADFLYGRDEEGRDYRQELADIYNKVRPLGLTDRAIQSIEDVTNPLLNSINEKCARIRRAFVTMLDKSIVDDYIIKGPRGEAKKIVLPRELVTWE